MMDDPDKSTTRRLFWLGAAGIAGIFLLLLVPVKKIPEEGWAASCWNLQHLPGFFIMTWCFQAVLKTLRPSGRNPFLAALLALFAAVASELLQAFVGRSASLEDVTLDSFGVALATLLPRRPYPVGSKKFLGWFVWSLILLGGIAFALAPAVKIEMEVREARLRLPDLGDFDRAEPSRLWKVQGFASIRTADGALQVRIGPGHFGGVNFLPRSQDWSAYSGLAIAFANPDPPFRLGVRIDDAGSADDRIWLSDEVAVGKGDTVVRIPLPRGPIGRNGRAIDYSRVNRLLLFVDKTDNAVEFSLRSATLEPSAEPPRL